MSRGKDFAKLLEEAQQMLTSVGEVVTSTMQQGVEVIKNYEQLANDKVSTIVKEKKKELSELSAYGENAKSCFEKMEIDFEKAEEKLRKELAACYKKHYGSVDKISTEKSTLHEEAKQIKNEIENEIGGCISAADKTDCFIKAFSSIKKKVNSLTSRMAEIIKKETETRVKASKAVLECDKKTIDEIYKKFEGMMNEFKKCAAKKP